MTKVQLKFSSMLFALLMTASHAASASYKETIKERTDRNDGISGKWFRLKATDWVFYEGEASAQYNMGAIAEGTAVEVLKWNRFMARVRLPDGRVVFIRNRLLTESSKPAASEIKSLAATTAAIGREKLHGGNRHVGATSADLSGKTQIEAITPASPDVKAATEIKPAEEVKPSTTVKADQPVDRNGRPVRVIEFNSPPTIKRWRAAQTG